MNGTHVGLLPASRITRRYHFHLPGIVFVFLTIVIALTAINFQNNLLFFAVGLCLAALLISGFVSGSVLMSVRAARVLSASGRLAVRTPGVLRIALENTGRLTPAFGLTLEELPEPADATRGRVRTAPAFVAHIGPRSGLAVDVPVLPTRRGRLALGSVRITSTLPFGLAKKSATFALPAEVFIRPAMADVSADVVSNLVSRAREGVRSSSARGTADEFYAVRDYVPGDPPRQIAWRSSARAGTLIVREHAAPSPVRLWIVLNPAAPVGTDAEDASRMAEAAISLVAGIAAKCLAAGLAVGLSVPARASIASPGDLVEPPRAGPLQLDRILDALAQLRIDPERLVGLSPNFPAQAAARSACVVVFASEIDDSFGPTHALRLSATAGTGVEA